MLKIKKEFHNTVIGYNNSGVVLGKRTQRDLIDLGIIAQESGQHKDKFVKLPSLKILRAMKMALLEKPTTAATPNVIQKPNRNF